MVVIRSTRYVFNTDLHLVLGEELCKEYLIQSSPGLSQMGPSAILMEPGRKEKINQAELRCKHRLPGRYQGMLNIMGVLGLSFCFISVSLDLGLFTM